MNSVNELDRALVCKLNQTSICLCTALDSARCLTNSEPPNTKTTEAQIHFQTWTGFIKSFGVLIQPAKEAHYLAMALVQ